MFNRHPTAIHHSSSKVTSGLPTGNGGNISRLDFLFLLRQGKRKETPGP